MTKLSVNHSCGDSGLRCVDCNQQVCPRCYVQCAVGNRCKKCAARFTSHVLKTPLPVLIRLAVFMIGLGFAYGYVAPLLLYMPLGFYGYVIEAFVFFAVGKVMHRIASFKLGAKVAATAFASLALGLYLGPLRNLLLAALDAARAAEPNSGMLNGCLVSLAIMMVAVLAPLMRKS